MRQPTQEDWNRLEVSTKDFMEYYNKTFGYIHGSEYREPINQAIFALRLAKEVLANQVVARQKAQEEIYQLKARLNLATEVIDDLEMK